VTFFRLSSENESDSTNEFNLIHNANEPCSISSKTKKPKLSLSAEEPEDSRVMSSTLVPAAPDTVAESTPLLESEDIALSTMYQSTSKLCSTPSFRVSQP